MTCFKVGYTIGTGGFYGLGRFDSIRLSLFCFAALLVVVFENDLTIGRILLKVKVWSFSASRLILTAMGFLTRVTIFILLGYCLFVSDRSWRLGFLTALDYWSWFDSSSLGLDRFLGVGLTIVTESERSVKALRSWVSLRVHSLGSEGGALVLALPLSVFRFANMLIGL